MILAKKPVAGQTSQLSEPDSSAQVLAVSEVLSRVRAESGVFPSSAVSVSEDSTATRLSSAAKTGVVKHDKEKMTARKRAAKPANTEASFLFRLTNTLIYDL